jgi:fimbrial chaperone protein
LNKKIFGVTVVKKIFLVLFFISIAIFYSFSFSFSPIVQDFDSSGKGKVKTFRIKNQSKEPIAVQINMLTRNMSRIGEEITNDASHLFSIYPHQLILQPNDFQSIRVQWNGPLIEENEQAFRIVAEQLPISFNQDNNSKGQLNIVYKYLGSVYVLPEKPYSDIILESIKIDNGNLKLTVKNRGTGHSILEDLVITLSDGKQNVSLHYEDLQGMAGENILAGLTREFVLDKPSQLSGEEISGEISYTETR